MAVKHITELPDRTDFVHFEPDFGPRFLLTVDTEEEFDWTLPIARTGHSVQAVPALARFQQFCEGHGVCPLYLVDHPIAASNEAANILREPLAARRAEIGVQLHPWVSPPFDEQVNVFNSFAGNLPEHLEREKLLRLRNRIEETFGEAPLVYRAGRYGVGPHTARILKEAGIAIDTSVRSGFDYSAVGGVNFRDFPLTPYWLDREGGLMEVPLTTVYWGMLRRQGSWLYPRLWRAPRLRSVLARLGLLERIPLTPEGVSLDEAIRGIDIALDDGLSLLVFSFHSPSLAPGHTPYVRNDHDLDDLYAWWRGVFAYLKRRGVAPASARELIAAVELA